MSKSLKILVLSTSYPIRVGSVSGVFVQSLVQALKRHCQTTVLTPADDLCEPSLARDVIPYKYAPRRMRVLAHKPGGIPAAIRNNSINILLIPAFILGYAINTFFYARSSNVILANWAVSGVVGGVIGVVLRKPQITVLRGEDVPDHIAGLNAIILRFAIHLSNRVVVVSSDMAESLRDRFPKCSHKLHVINNGVDDRFWSLSRRSQGRPHSTLCLMTVGSLIKRKNVEYVLRELSNLEVAGIQFSYKIVGDGPARTELEKLAHALGIGDRVEFCGTLIGDKLIDVYRSAAFFISASLHEGRPNAVMEAIASGLVPLISDIRGHREIASKLTDDVLFNSRVPGSLYELLIRINKSVEFRETLLGAVHANASAITSTWDETAKKYLEVIQNVLECPSVSGDC